MAPTDDRSPLARPQFLVAAGVVVVIVVAGLVLLFSSLSKGDEQSAPPPTAEPSAAPSATTEAPAQDDDESVCGLDEVELEGRITSAPQANWQHDGPMAHPSADEHGPGEVNPAGVRYCFSHTPEGAVFAAASAAAHNADPDTITPWWEWALAEGDQRDALVEKGRFDEHVGGVRLEIGGFRLLTYSGDSATVDVAYTGSVQGEAATGSLILHLVWQDGDWKLDTSGTRPPLDLTAVPNTAGYIEWGAESDG